MTNADRKAAIRERMARTGENYSTAKRAIEQARGHARERVSPQNDLALERAVYAAYDQGTVAGFLAQELFSTAVWREGKAAEYPDDDRNLPAAEHLAGLAKQIVALPDDDPRILRMESAVQAIADANGDLPTTSEITRTIGFSGGYPSLDELLDSYVQEHEHMLKQPVSILSMQEVAGHVFISHVREDSDRIDELQRALEAAGVRVWRDKADLWPGQDWRAMIRHAITDNALVFIACFSTHRAARTVSYQNAEVLLAIEQLQLRPPGTSWLIPVRLDDCQVPDFDIGGGRTLGSIQRVDLFGDGHQEQLNRLVVSVKRLLRQLSPGEDSPS